MSRKHCRTIERNRGTRILNVNQVRVALFDAFQDSELWGAWKYQTVSLAVAQRMVMSGKAIAITRKVEGHVRVVGYRKLQASRVLRRSKCTLTQGTMNAVAEATDRDSKLSRGQYHHVVKFRVWAVIPESFRDADGVFHPDGVYKSPTIRPRISDEDRKWAETLLAPKPCRSRA